MMKYTAVLLVPVAARDNANAMGEALGWGPGNFSVPLSADGYEPATHHGLHTFATQVFVDMLNGAGQGTLPEGVPWASYGLTEADVFGVLAAMTASVQGFGAVLPGNHFDSVLAAANLRRLGDVEEPPNDE
jgi:hypothetical protein